MGSNFDPGLGTELKHRSRLLIAPRNLPCALGVLDPVFDGQSTHKTQERKSKKKQGKRDFKKLPEAKLRFLDPEGGKPTLAHLSGPSSLKGIFPKIWKHQKRCQNELPEPEVRQRGHEGRKLTMAHLFRPSSPKRIFLATTST